jgi:hypothetical protein
MSDLSAIIEAEDRLAFASYIENGGDLSSINIFQRSMLASIVRGNTAERHLDICRQVAFLKGTGLPVYTDSQKRRKSPVVESNTEVSDDACTVVGEVMGRKPEYVQKIWQKRTQDMQLDLCEAHGKKIAQLYQDGCIDPPRRQKNIL